MLVSTVVYSTEICHLLQKTSTKTKMFASPPRLFPTLRSTRRINAQQRPIKMRRNYNPHHFPQLLDISGP